MDGQAFDTAQNKPKVLLVEDNETYRKVVKNAMQLDEFEYYEAENGQKALELVKALKPQIVLCDIAMPVMDGMTFLTEIKKDPELATIPIIMLTNYQEELENAVKAGAEEALLKSSLTPRQLIEVCRKHVFAETPNATT